MKKNILYVFVFVIYLISVVNGSAEVNRQEYFIKHIRIEDGLSQSTVQCMIQDRKGYLWFGTANGLNRYDGYSFKVFSNIPGDFASLTDNGITALYEDKEGNIYVGTGEGNLNLYVRKKGIFQRFNITDNLSSEENIVENLFDYPLPYSRNSARTITSIAKDKEGNLWIGTWGLGLLKFNSKLNSIEQFHYNDRMHKSFHANRIFKVVTDKEGNIWVASLGTGLYKIIHNGEKTEVQNFSHSKTKYSSISNNLVTSLLFDKEDNLWIGTYGGGMNKLTKTNQSVSLTKANFVRYGFQVNKNSLSANIITSIIQDRKENLWIGTLGGGLNCYDLKTGKFTVFKNDPRDENSISKNEIIAVFEDRSSNIWIGTHLGVGLSKLYFMNKKFHLIKKDVTEKHGLNDDVVWSIYADGDTAVWIGTFKGGLNLWNRKKNSFSYYKACTGSINDNHIRAIVDDGKGNLLIGTYSGGLNIFNKKTKTSRNYKNDPNNPASLSANQVQGIFIDRVGNYWIGTFGGGLDFVSKELVERGDLQFKHYKHDPRNSASISDNRAYSIFEDRTGVIWVGTFGGGLNKYNKITDSFTSYKNKPGNNFSLGDNRIMFAMEDSFGTLWIGTYGGALQSFDKKTEKFTRYSDLTRLKSSVVYCIQEDNNKHLWMSTDNGLYKMNILTKQFTQYDQHDGVQSLEFSGGAVSKSKSGEIFLGGVNGVNYFLPERIQENSVIPPIVISNIKIFNEAVKEETDTIKLSYNQNFFSFEFSSLDFTDPSANQYAYMLEGFDKEWHFVDPRMRMISYTNLSPGTYMFSVIGSNNDGVWNYDGANICVIILPPFWRRWWFITFVAIITTIGFYYITTLRYRNLLAIEKLKSKLSSDLHDSVGSGLTEISILSELAANELQKISGNTSEKLTSISDKARLLIDNMSDIVWMINPHKDSLHDLIVRLKDSYSDLMHAAGISFKTNNLEKLSSLKLTMEFKQNLFLIFKEAINNAIKHSQCNRIIIYTEFEKDILHLSVNDNGCGIGKLSSGAGNGIINMKKRAETLGGKIEINSSENGTTILFKGKINGLNKIFAWMKR